MDEFKAGTSASNNSHYVHHTYLSAASPIPPNPSNALMETADKLLFKNSKAALKDFHRIVELTGLVFFEPREVDKCFLFFITGANNLMNPESSFNKEFKC